VDRVLVWKRNVDPAKNRTPLLTLSRSFVVMLALRRLAKSSRLAQLGKFQIFCFFVNYKKSQQESLWL
jgi:hypothetical protein